MKTKPIHVFLWKRVNYAGKVVTTVSDLSCLSMDDPEVLAEGLVEFDIPLAREALADAHLIDSLRAAQKEAKAKFCQADQELEETIQSLLALPAPCDGH